MKKQTKSETETLLMLDKKDLKRLPLTTQKLINELTEDLNIKGLNIFNPIIKAMIDVESFKELKYIADDKDNAKQFTRNKVLIGKFNASVGRAKKKLKAPLLAQGKLIDSIEKVFKGRASDVKTHLLEEFSELIKIQEEAKKAKEEKKNKASIDKIAELSDESIQNKLIINRMKIKQKIDKEIQEITSNAIKQVNTFSKEALKKELNDLLNYNEFSLEEVEKATLLEEQKAEIEANFNTAIKGAIQMIELKINSFNTPLSVPVPLSNNSIEMVAPSLTQENPEYFKDAMCHIIDEAINNINNLNPAIEKETNVKVGTISSLEKTKLKIIGYLSNE